MKIGVFGGTFDPPHLAHEALVNAVLDQGLFDEVWYLPVAVHQTQFQKEQMSSVEHRVALLQFLQTPKTRIERIEIDAMQTSHTHSTLRRLRRRHPSHTFSFIMGSDQLPKLHLWNCEEDEHCFPQAADEFDYFVYPRLGYPMELPFSNLKVITNVEPIALSSTEIRAKVAVQLPINNLVQPEVANYIHQQRLYEKQPT